jgi:hypothetical protein
MANNFQINSAQFIGSSNGLIGDLRAGQRGLYPNRRLPIRVRRGFAGVESYLGPLMLAASTSLYQSAGSNPTVNSMSAIPFNVNTPTYQNAPTSWSA